MKSKKGSGEKGISGTAKCVVGESGFTFVFVDGDSEGERFKFKNSALPDDLPDSFELENGKQYFISLNSDGDEIRSIRPVRGFFPVKVADFARNQDEDILILERNHKQYGKFFQFIALLEVLESEGDKYTGLRIPLYLPFGNEGRPKFQRDDDGNVILVGSAEKSKPFAQLLDFANYTVGDKDVLFDEDNQQLLSNFLSVILKKKAKFYVTLDRGYVKSMSSSDEEGSDEDEPEEKPAKKPSKPAKKTEDDEEDDEDMRN